MRIPASSTSCSRVATRCVFVHERSMPRQRNVKHGLGRDHLSTHAMRIICKALLNDLVSWYMSVCEHCWHDRMVRVCNGEVSAADHEQAAA